MGSRWRWMQTATFVLALIVFVCGLGWGLPSRDADSFLFGGCAAWTGKQLLALSHATFDPNRASDVDANPLDRSRPIIVNQTDAQRAEIVRRYRLFTNQPDEMQTLMALAAMKPGQADFDPRMYKYGGLWIYPIGAMLKAASMLGWIDLRSDLAFYLDHPDAFAKFYVVARLYTVSWAMIGVWAVMWIVRRVHASAELQPTSDEKISRSTSISHRSALIAGVCFIFMPVVLNMAHEAKPHLPGAVLVLLATITGMKYIDSCRRRWLWQTGALCGAAVGMVLSAWVALAVLFAIAIVRREIAAIMVAVVIALSVYFLTNPYVAINLIANPAVVRSNVGNSAAFYHVGWDAFANAAMLVRAGTSTLLAIAGLIGSVVLVRRRQDVLLLVAAPALATAIPFFLFASSQPPDYARFALTIDIALMIAAIVSIGRIKSATPRIALMSVLMLSIVVCGVVMSRGFFRDRGSQTSRLAAAREIEGWKQLGLRRLVIRDEPSPYCLPPVDLWHWQIILLPRDATDDQFLAAGDLAVRVDHDRIDLAGRRISWADKRFSIQPGRD